MEENKPQISIDTLIGYAEGLMEGSNNEKMRGALAKLVRMLQKFKNEHKTNTH